MAEPRFLGHQHVGSTLRTLITAHEKEMGFVYTETLPFDPSTQSGFPNHFRPVSIFKTLLPED